MSSCFPGCNQNSRIVRNPPYIRPQRPIALPLRFAEIGSAERAPEKFKVVLIDQVHQRWYVDRLQGQVQFVGRWRCRSRRGVANQEYYKQQRNSEQSQCDCHDLPTILRPPNAMGRILEFIQAMLESRAKL